MSNLNALEQAVMGKFLEGNVEGLSILREQFESIDVVKREFTGVGFHTTFTLPQETHSLPGNRSLNLDDVVANIGGLKNGAGFLLFIRDGRLCQLEGYSYGGESWPLEVTSFEVGYLVGNKMAKQRDIEALHKDLMPPAAS